jgi:hypothetical protein
MWSMTKPEYAVDVILFFLLATHTLSVYAQLLKLQTMEVHLQNFSMNFPIDTVAAHSRHTMFISNNDTTEHSDSRSSFDAPMAHYLPCPQLMHPACKFHLLIHCSAALTHNICTNLIHHCRPLSERLNYACA